MPLRCAGVIPASPGVAAISVVVDLVTVELPLQIAVGPKQSLIEVIALDGPVCGESLILAEGDDGVETC